MEEEDSKRAPDTHKMFSLPFWPKIMLKNEFIKCYLFSIRVYSGVGTSY